MLEGALAGHPETSIFAAGTSCLPAVNRWTAAWRGAFVSTLWAAALLALLASLRVLGRHDGIFTVADPLFDGKAFQARPGLVVAASILAAALVGAIFGALARRVNAPASVRAIILVLASFPALWVLIAVALSLIWLPQAANADLLSAALFLPLGSLMYAAYGMVMVVPVAALPATLAALMLEGWTRPEASPPFAECYAQLPGDSCKSHGAIGRSRRSRPSCTRIGGGGHVASSSMVPHPQAAWRTLAGRPSGSWHGRCSLGVQPAPGTPGAKEGFMGGSSGKRRGKRSRGTDLVLALVVASALPCAALLWPGRVPQEIVVLSLIAWVGIFVVALWSVRAEDRRRRQGRS